jgi:hypothetical protein
MNKFYWAKRFLKLIEIKYCEIIFHGSGALEPPEAFFTTFIKEEKAIIFLVLEG